MLNRQTLIKLTQNSLDVTTSVSSTNSVHRHSMRSIVWWFQTVFASAVWLRPLCPIQLIIRVKAIQHILDQYEPIIAAFEEMGLTQREMWQSELLDYWSSSNRNTTAFLLLAGNVQDGQKASHQNVTALSDSSFWRYKVYADIAEVTWGGGVKRQHFAGYFFGNFRYESRVIT